MMALFRRRVFNWRGWGLILLGIPRLLALLFQMVGQINDQIALGLKNPRVVLVVESDVNLINLQSTRPRVGVSNDYPVVKFMLTKPEDVDVFRCHHRANIFLLIRQIVIPHKLFGPI